MSIWRRTFVAIMALGLTTLVGCAAGHEDSVAEPDASQAASAPAKSDVVLSEAGQQKITEDLAQLASDLALVSPPDVEIERLVSLADHFPIYAECMTSAGFPTKLTADGQGTETDIPNGQSAAFDLADYTCTARFPVDPDQDLTRLTSAQKRRVYQYLAVSLVECLGEHGYVVNDVPDEDVFLAGYDQSAPWNPYTQIFAGNLSASDQTALQSACPTNTPPEIIYGR